MSTSSIIVDMNHRDIAWRLLEDNNIPIKSNAQSNSDTNRRTKGKAIQSAALISGIIGFSIAFCFQFYSMFEHYPQLSSNRGVLTILNFLPISFEFSVLLAGISSLLTFIIFGLKRKNQIKSEFFTNGIIEGDGNNLRIVIDILIENQINYKQIEEN
jgi:hypothetical protein